MGPWGRPYCETPLWAGLRGVTSFGMASAGTEPIWWTQWGEPAGWNLMGLDPAGRHPIGQDPAAWKYAVRRPMGRAPQDKALLKTMAWDQSGVLPYGVGPKGVEPAE